MHLDELMTLQFPLEEVSIVTGNYLFLQKRNLKIIFGGLHFAGLTVIRNMLRRSICSMWNNAERILTRAKTYVERVGEQMLNSFLCFIYSLILDITLFY